MAVGGGTPVVTREDPVSYGSVEEGRGMQHLVQWVDANTDKCKFKERIHPLLWIGGTVLTGVAAWIGGPALMGEAALGGGLIAGMPLMVLTCCRTKRR